MMKIFHFLLMITIIVVEGEKELYHQNHQKENDNEGIHHKRQSDSTNVLGSEPTVITPPDEAEEGSEGESSKDTGTEPLAEKFIGPRRKRPPHPDDILREKMIGMIFTGKPQLLGVRPRIDERRRLFQTFPETRRISETPFKRDSILHESPSLILKPMPFVPHDSNVELPLPVLYASASRDRPHFLRGPPPKSHLNLRPNPRRSRPRKSHRRPPLRRPKPFRHGGKENSFSVSKDIFSNTVGPDFGPVTFEDFGANFETNLGEFDFPRLPQKPHKPFSLDPAKPSFNPTETKPEPPFGFSDTSFSEFDKTPEFETHPTLNLGPDGCQKYTEDICLNTDNYPHEEILASLVRDPSKAGSLMAEVKEQSADELVDGITANQEEKYDYTHYFGTRRSEAKTSEVRDFAEDGGFLCPSEVKYGRPKRARNSKGNWKFIVNMDKYSQTIRMERCMQPGGSCSYVSHHYRATCNQIYNYQRLLSWEKLKGLHMDIFKTPTCCSCHIEGYAYLFPPLHKSDSLFTASEAFDELSFSETGIKKNIYSRAPPFSHINHPKLRVEGKTILKNEKTRVRGSRRGQNTRNSSYHDKPGSHDNGLSSRINYAYHPILDFIENSSEMK